MDKKKNIIKKPDKNREIYWVIGVMAAMILILTLAPMIFRSINTFTVYDSLTFTKERYDEIPVYHYYYYFTDDDGQQYQYNLYLRIDPRENHVPVQGEIIFPKDKDVYLSINGTGLTQCKYSSTAINSLS